MNVVLLNGSEPTAEALADPLWTGTFTQFFLDNCHNMDLPTSYFAGWLDTLERGEVVHLGGGAAPDFILVTAGWAETRKRTAHAFSGVAAVPAGWEYVDTSTPESDAARDDRLWAQGFRFAMPLKD